ASPSLSPSAARGAGSSPSTAARPNVSPPANPTPSGPTTPGCGPADCVTLDATSFIGPANPVASGLNDGVRAGDGADITAMKALSTRNFRGAPSYGLLGTLNWKQWDTAAQSGSAMTLILSNMWEEQYGPYPPTPWSNWTRYTSWVQSTVRTIVRSGQKVTYWDVYNEPGFPGYYSPEAFQSVTPARLLQQFLVTYQAIKAVDPGAQIIGPSTGEWSLTPLPAGDPIHEADLGTFLRFCAAHRLKLAAVAWHDNSKSPATIYSDAQATKALIATLPALGHPPMILDEYASQGTQPIPGWDVGFLAAVTDAGFISASRSCWGGACTDGELDGLLAPDGVTKSSEYWERLDYARMTGNMVSVSTTDPSVQALGSFTSSGGGQFSALIGRSAGCGSPAWCRAEFAPGTQPAAAAPVQVRILLPFASPVPTIKISDIPFAPGVWAPVAPRVQQLTDYSITTVGAGTEWVDFTIPAFADGEAFSITAVP
ncbi:MAG TPA: hypothetical protein VFH70_08995, partial [Acidimicrobiales bacterium]|nr:hypothetical protein [Acidimicrobiales bacterium]